MPSSCVAVVTTIQTPTSAMAGLADVLGRHGMPLIVIGDKKGPTSFHLPGARFYGLEEQLGLPYQLASRLPTGHYARKNLGYLLAIARGAECIYETDDDNRPIDGWLPRQLTTQAIDAPATPWCNVYRYFTDAMIWPRGFLLDQIRTEPRVAVIDGGAIKSFEAPIQQGLANGSPDVDAIWRLVCDQDITFRDHPSVRLPPFTWCPFNSQTTWWYPAAYPLLYLPSHCSFRMTDIWRSFVAQRCLWELGQGIVFHAAEVHQDRNCHRLIRDFEDEVPGYTGNGPLTECLAALSLRIGANAVGGNLRHCYEQLISKGFLPPEELPLIEVWLNDLSSLGVIGRAGT